MYQFSIINNQKYRFLFFSLFTTLDIKEMRAMSVARLPAGEERRGRRGELAAAGARPGEAPSGHESSPEAPHGREPPRHCRPTPAPAPPDGFVQPEG